MGELWPVDGLLGVTMLIETPDGIGRSVRDIVFLNADEYVSAGRSKEAAGIAGTDVMAVNGPLLVLN